MPGRTVLGAGQYYWQKYESGAAAAKTWKDLCSYTVPAGRRVYIAAGFVDASKPALFSMKITFPPITDFPMKFNTLWAFTLNPVAAFVVEETLTLKVSCYNHMVGSVTFGAILIGFEEVI